MKSLIKNSLFVIAITSLVGCSSLGEVFISGTNAAYVLDQNGSMKETILKADLTQAEIDKVNDAQRVILNLRDKFDTVNASELLTIADDYFDARGAYLSVYDVVVSHEQDYTQDEWQAFEDAHNVAMTLDEEVQSYINKMGDRETASMALQYLNAAAKLAALL